MAKGRKKLLHLALTLAIPGDICKINGLFTLLLHLPNLCPIKEPTIQIPSVQFSGSVMSDSLRPHGLQHARIPCPSPSPRVSSNSCSLSQWCHPTISSFVIPFFSCLQSFPTIGSFLMNQVYASGGKSIGASASFLPMNTQGWFCLGLTDVISFQSKGLSRVFSNSTD